MNREMMWKWYWVAAAVLWCSAGAFVFGQTAVVPQREHVSAPVERSGTRAGSAKRAICIVHCDPVPKRAFEANWARLEDLVATADAYGAKLSLHFAGSYATLAREAGKIETVCKWLSRGHGAGAHPHPEYLKDGRWFKQTPWTAFPQEKTASAMVQNTDAINQRVPICPTSHVS